MGQQVGGQPHFQGTDATAYVGNSISTGQPSQGLPAPNPLRDASGDPHTATLQNGACMSSGSNAPVHANNPSNNTIAHAANQVLAQGANQPSPAMADLNVTAILLNAEADAQQLAGNTPAEAADAKMAFDMPSLDLDALLGDIFTAKPDAVIDNSAVSVHGSTQVVHLAGLVDVNEGVFSSKDIVRYKLLDVSEQVEYLTNVPGFSNNHVLFTTSDKPLTKEAVAAYEKLAQNFHAANPHIPPKPLVIVVLDKDSWDKFQVSLSLNFGGHESVNNERIVEKSDVKHSNVKKNVQISDQQPAVKHIINRRLSDTVDRGFEIQKLVSKVIKQMQKIGDEEAAAKRDAIKRDYIAQEKEQSFRKSDEIKHDQRNWEANNRTLPR